MAVRSKSPRFFELNPFSNVEFIEVGDTKNHRNHKNFNRKIKL